MTWVVFLLKHSIIFTKSVLLSLPYFYYQLYMCIFHVISGKLTNRKNGLANFLAYPCDRNRPMPLGSRSASFTWKPT